MHIHIKHAFNQREMAALCKAFLKSLPVFEELNIQIKKRKDFLPIKVIKIRCE